jgi:C-terminal processing protease CtpA/Prc
VGTEVPPYDQIFAYAGYRLDRLQRRQPYIGVSYNTTEQGFEVTDMDADAAAAHAGLQRGDVITKVDGAAVRSSVGGSGASLQRLLDGRIDQTIKITVRRGGEEKTLDVRVGSRPGPPESVDYKLAEVSNPTPEQLKVREAWLKTGGNKAEARP